MVKTKEITEVKQREKSFVPFTAKIINVGNSFMVTIPKDYVKFGVLKQGIEYNFMIERE